MRIIAGIAKGMPLKFLKDNIKVRPTTNRVKEALFSSLSVLVSQPKNALDLCAGIGSLGLEILSRFESCHLTFVDSYLWQIH